MCKELKAPCKATELQKYICTQDLFTFLHTFPYFGKAGDMCVRTCLLLETCMQQGEGVQEGVVAWTAGD